MDWGFIFQVTLAVLNTALIVGGIVGGIVAYGGSAATSVRSFTAAGIASGVVMPSGALSNQPMIRGATAKGEPPTAARPGRYQESVR